MKPCLAILLLLAASSAVAALPFKDGDRIAFLGDSITQLGTDNPRGWVNLVERAIRAQSPEVSFIHAGISGDKSSQMIVRYEQDVRHRSPTWMFFSCGVNDAPNGLTGRSRNRGLPLAAYKANVETILDWAKEDGTQVIVLSQTPVLETPVDHVANQNLKPYNEVLKAAALARGLVYLDPGAAIRAAIDTKANSEKLEYTVDGTHPNDTGNAIIAKTVLAGLDRPAAPSDTVRIGLETLDLSTMTSGWNPATVNTANGGTPFKIGAETFARGVGTHAPSLYELDVKGEVVRFTATIGADAGLDYAKLGTVTFSVYADGERVFVSPVHRYGGAAQRIDVPLRGAKRVLLVVEDGGDGLCNDIADWCEADFEVTRGTTLRTVGHATSAEQFGILSPKAGPEPRLNAPYVFGVRPNHPVLFTVPCSGERPMTFSAKGLPAGATLDPKTGFLSGKVAARGEYAVSVTAKNAKGADTRVYRLVVGDRIALTPPMGWNSWNCFASAVSAKDIRAAADAFERERLVDFGWSYVNIDDFWCNYQKKDAHPDIQGPMRRRDGSVIANARFPDMKGLADYVHAKGLKVGLYSSPGPLTCGKCTGSWGYEAIDAATWAAWGFDYVKYDWCSYGKVAVAQDSGPLYFQAPYLKMGRELARQDRDILFSLCQYGMDRVSQWGEKVGGQCWRTTGDIEDTWASMRYIAKAQQGLERYAGPGAWNDPDMLIVGWVGWGPKLHPTRLTANEQYTHMTYWSLFAAPLLIGCDLTKLDDFTRAILTNPEVLAVNQDPLGKAAARVAGDAPGFFEDVWARPLEDGSIALGIVNLGYDKRTIAVDLKKLGLVGEWKVRDLWRRADEKPVRDVYSVSLPSHAPHFVRLAPGKDGCLAPGVADVRDAAWNVHFGPKRDTKATVADDCPLCPK